MDVVDDAKAAIEELESPIIDEIPFFLLERPENKTTRLLANSGSTQPLEGRNKSYRYLFKEPVFLSYLVVNVAGYNQFDRFDILVQDETGREKKFSGNPKDDQLTININEFCQSVSFEPPTAWLRNPTIQSVKLFGFRKEQSSSFIDFVGQIDQLKDAAINELDKLQDQAQARIDVAKESEGKLAILRSELNDADKTLAEVRAQVQSATSDLNSVVAKNGATAKQLEGTEERLSNLRGDIKLETQRKEGLQAEIVTQEAKLRELQANINLFPSEISGFADQASSNSNVYLHYAFGPMIILCGMFLMLIGGAVDLTTVITTNKDVNLAAILVSRAPYVAVATAIIYASYRIAKTFISEVMHINRQRLSLTKISIIAKDISQAAEDNVQLNPNQIYANRLKVKMALLSDHIRHLIDTDPEILFPETLFPAIPISDSKPEAGVASPTAKTSTTSRRASTRQRSGQGSPSTSGTSP